MIKFNLRSWKEYILLQIKNKEYRHKIHFEKDGTKTEYGIVEEGNFQLEFCLNERTFKNIERAFNFGLPKKSRIYLVSENENF